MLLKYNVVVYPVHCTLIKNSGLTKVKKAGYTSDKFRVEGGLLWTLTSEGENLPKK